MNKKYLVIILAVLLLFSLMILFGFIRKSSDNNPNLENNLAKENVNSPETLNINDFNQLESLGDDINSLEITSSNLDQDIDITI